MEECWALGGGTPDIDIEDLRANTEYTGYSAASPQVRSFWHVVRDMNKEDRARLLMFCTGTSKVPLDGFKALQGISGPQRFQIHKAGCCSWRSSFTPGSPRLVSALEA